MRNKCLIVLCNYFFAFQTWHLALGRRIVFTSLNILLESRLGKGDGSLLKNVLPLEEQPFILEILWIVSPSPVLTECCFPYIM